MQQQRALGVHNDIQILVRYGTENFAVYIILGAARDGTGQYNGVSVLQILQLLAQRVNVLLCRERTDAVDGAFDGIYHLDVNAAESCIERKEIVRNSVLAHDSFDLRAGKSGNKSESQTWLLQNMKRICDIDAFAAGHEPFIPCAVDAA